MRKLELSRSTLYTSVPSGNFQKLLLSHYCNLLRLAIPLPPSRRNGKVKCEIPPMEILRFAESNDAALNCIN